MHICLGLARGDYCWEGELNLFIAFLNEFVHAINNAS